MTAFDITSLNLQNFSCPSRHGSPLPHPQGHSGSDLSPSTFQDFFEVPPLYGPHMCICPVRIPAWPALPHSLPIDLVPWQLSQQIYTDGQIRPGDNRQKCCDRTSPHGGHSSHALMPLPHRGPRSGGWPVLLSEECLRCGQRGTKRDACPPSSLPGRREGLEGALGVPGLGQCSCIPMSQPSGCAPGALPGKLALQEHSDNCSFL